MKTVLSAQGGPFRVLENDTSPITELTKTKRTVRAYRWQLRRNRARMRALRMHTIFLESFGLHDQGSLAPSLLLGVPSFLLGVVVSLLFHLPVALTLATATASFVLASCCAAWFYYAMPHERIQEELQRLQDRDGADQARIHAYEQRHNQLRLIVERRYRAEAERAHQQQLMESREVERVQRLRTLIGYQQEDPWGTVAIVFSCLSMILAILGLFTFGVAYLVALPFAVLGFLCAIGSNSGRRGVALTLSLLTVSPVLLILLSWVFRRW
jgi:hypothetical protein